MGSAQTPGPLSLAPPPWSDDSACRWPVSRPPETQGGCNPGGLIDPGRCIGVTATAGVVYQSTAYPATANGRWLWYLLGLPVSESQHTG